jgi:hypothetical protein
MGLLSMGDVARRFNLMDWQVRRAIRRGYVAEPGRLAGRRVWHERDLPKIQAGLAKCGRHRAGAARTARGEVEGGWAHH